MEVKFEMLNAGNSLVGLASSAGEHFVVGEYGDFMCLGGINSPAHLQGVDAPPTAIAMSGNGELLAVAHKDGEEISLYEHPSHVIKDAQLLRCELPVSHLEFSGDHLYVSGQDPVITVCPVDGTGNPFKVRTNDKGVTTFATKRVADNSSSGATLIAFVDNDGDVHIVNIPLSGVDLDCVSSNLLDSKPRLVDREFARSNKCKISWSPDRYLLAVPSKEIIALLSSEDEGVTWAESMLCTADSDSNSFYQILTFSPDGRHLAASQSGGKIAVWQINQKRPADSSIVSTFQCPSSEGIVDMVWGAGPEDNHLVVLSATSWAKIENAVPNMRASAVSITTTTEIQDTTIVNMGDESAPIKANSATTASNKTDDDEKMASENAGNADEMDVIQPEMNKRRLQKKSGNDTTAEDDDDEADAIFADDDNTNLTKIKNATIGTVALDNDDEEEDGDEDKDWDAAKNLVIPRLEEFEEAIHKAKAYLAPIHERFQPSSTAQDGKARRYLVWNSVGNITAREEGTGDKDGKEGRYEIRFSNAMGRNKQDAFNESGRIYTMASLAFEGAIFASALPDIDPDIAQESQLGSYIHYRAFASHLDGANETFSLQLSDREEALAVAVGQGWSAVATSKGFLRIFSSTGAQLSVTWLKGPVVALCGYAAQLAIVVNAAHPLEETPRLSVELLAIHPFSPGCSRSILSDMMLPLSAKSKLEWIGFDVESKFLTVIDSAGMLSMLMHPFGWQWVPVLDIAKAKKSQEHRLWPIMTKNAKLVYVLLNGESMPAIYPQPVTAVKALRIPIIEEQVRKQYKERDEALNESYHLFALETTKAAHFHSLKSQDTVFGYIPIESHLNVEQLEQRFKDQENEADKTVLKLLQRACAATKTSRALDLAHKLRTLKGIEGAILIANHHGRQLVAKKLQEIQDQRFPQTVEPEETNGYYQPPGQQIYSERNTNEEESDLVGAQDENDGNHHLHETSFQAKSKSVTPTVPQPEKRVAVNPFAKGAASPLGKRKTGYDIKDLKTFKSSPSPSKKPTLARQSSFTEGAREQRSQQKNIL